MRQNGNDTKSHALDTIFQPPSLPAENEKLEVYADYVASLEAFEERLQGYVAWLKGHALIRAKAVSGAGYDAIIDTFGWGRSTGYLYKAIAENVTEDDARTASINELRRRVYNTDVSEPTETDSTDPPEDKTPPKMYSVKTAIADLKAIRIRLKKFIDGIGSTRDALNETQSTPMALSSMDTQFQELRELLKAADRARLEAVVATSATRHDRVIERVKNWWRWARLIWWLSSLLFVHVGSFLRLFL